MVASGLGVKSSGEGDALCDAEALAQVEREREGELLEVPHSEPVPDAHCDGDGEGVSEGVAHAEALRDAVAHELPDAVPEILAVERVEPDQLLQPALHQRAHCLAAASFHRAGDALVGFDTQDGGFRHLAFGRAIPGAGEARPPAERITDPGVLDEIALDIGDAH